MSKYVQADFVISEPTMLVGDRQPTLFQVVKWKRENYILTPPFQREYIWPEKKLVGWINTVINQVSIGCIVTYQVGGRGPNYLADGLQRITATERFLQDPIGYGFSFGSNDARRMCEVFSVTLQHRHYSSHDIAMEAFQNLNKGTSLTPSEFYKGELTLTDLGQFIWKNIPETVYKMHTGLSTSSRAINRTRASTLQRDAFSLFLQYISEEKGTGLWNVTSIESKYRPIEKALMEYIKEKSFSFQDIRSNIKNFERFLEDEIALFRNLMNETGQKGRNVSPAVLRWVMHLAIWRRNTGRFVNVYKDFLSSLLVCLEPYGSVTSRFLPPCQEGGKLTAITLQTGKLDHLERLSKAFNVPLYEKPKRRQKKKAAPGYHVSHHLPFSTHGDGETIIEPAPLNLARGAKPIT